MRITPIIGLLLGCGTPRAPEPQVAPPIASDTPPAPTPVVVAPTPPPDPFEGMSAKCRGVNLSFDSEESEDACLIPNTNDHTLPPRPDKLEITAAVLESSIKPGGTGTVVVTMTNTTTAPMQVFVDMSCDQELAFSTSILDANNKRIDFLRHKTCDRSYGCTRRVLRLVLEPGGSMHKKRTFSATTQKQLADCEGVTIATLKPGSYTMRVVNGFDRDAEGIYRAVTDTPFVVKR